MWLSARVNSAVHKNYSYDFRLRKRNKQIGTEKKSYLQNEKYT